MHSCSPGLTDACTNMEFSLQRDESTAIVPVEALSFSGQARLSIVSGVRMEAKAGNQRERGEDAERGGD